jgi:hypothetical protein
MLLLLFSRKIFKTFDRKRLGSGKFYGHLALLPDSLESPLSPDAPFKAIKCIFVDEIWRFISCGHDFRTKNFLPSQKRSSPQQLGKI